MRLKKWEFAFVLALVATVLCGSTLSREQDALSDKLIRLHVVANSDEAHDQELKLRVRDAVLAALAPCLDGVTDAATARAIVAENLPLVEAAAQHEIARSGYNYNASASLRAENFPTRRYDTFSLPAGIYESLRVEIGSAGGQNWWCVVFPPLCTEVISPNVEITSTTTDSVAGNGDISDPFSALDDAEIKLITEDDGYVVRFRAMELLGKLKNILRK